MASTEQAKQLVKVGDIQNATLKLPRHSLEGAVKRIAEHPVRAVSGGNREPAWAGNSLSGRQGSFVSCLTQP